MIIECSECREFVETIDHGGYKRRFGGQAPECAYSLLCCVKCGAPILVRQTNIGNMGEGDKWGMPFVMFPTSEGKVNGNVPDNIRAAFDEACKAYRGALYNSAAIMCRKTIDGVCTAHGIAAGNLAVSLQKMRDDDVIDERLYEWSTVLRHLGNGAAHDIAVTTTQPDAKDAIEFTNAILDYLFSYRDRFEEFKSRRAAKPAARTAE